MSFCPFVCCAGVGVFAFFAKEVNVAFVQGLKCRECGARYPDAPIYVCEECFGPLEVEYDYAAMRGVVTRERIQAGPFNMWRYRDLLPVGDGPTVGLDPGFTPLIKANRLGQALGLTNLWLKNDCVNPSYSFKDRVVAVAVTRAVEFGFDTVGCASTGNLANSVAANAARAGLRAFVFIPADLEEAKIAASSVYGPTVVAVNGTYDDVNRLCSLLAEQLGWAFVNVNVRPYYAEGAKTLAYEVAEQLGWRAPDHVVAPMASGSLLVKIRKGFDELRRLGLIPDTPMRVSGAQAEGCSPIVSAFKAGTTQIKPVRPDTIAKSLAIGAPADGVFALQAFAETGGYGESATDKEIVEGMRLLAQTEGIFAETAGGVTIAALRKLALDGKIGRNELTVAYITGNGLKTQVALNGRLPRVIQIEPSVRALLGALEADDASHQLRA
jgi:threonine synthase